jgi:lipoprotein-anchoring transpeptidase ErfK/SrfK
MANRRLSCYNFSMSSKLTRRDFLKLGAFSLGSLAFRPLEPRSWYEPDGNLARITIESVSVHSQPWDESRIVYQRYRDELIHTYYKVISEQGPEYNPVWYRVWGGYIHSARLQHVTNQFNPVAYTLPERGQLAELTIPFADSLQYLGKNGWKPLYRLYYKSVHWVVDVVEGPDQRPWYKIEEAWSKLTYHVPAETMRLFQPEELTPISIDVPAHEKRIEISIARQVLTAYEGDQAVFTCRVSTGLNRRVPEGEIPWRTPSGTFNISSKMPSKHMGNGDLTSDIQAYELPGVPWVCFFHETGVATHGTYWHTNYGTPMSHGCVNMVTDESKWLFLWTTPVWDPVSREQRGMGTRVIVS